MQYELASYCCNLDEDDQFIMQKWKLVTTGLIGLKSVQESDDLVTCSGYIESTWVCYCLKKYQSENI
jgi:hypothetical protein